jgi:excisionase family DNA binding protein
MTTTIRGDLGSRIALRPKEAADALGVSDRTLRMWMRDQELPYFQIDRGILIPTAELREWIRDRLVRQTTTDDLADDILDGFSKIH